MSTTRLIPADVQLAAKRGFIRTACQSLSSAIPTSAIAIVTTGEWLLGAALGVGGAVITAALAGAASYFSITGQGIPGDYQAGQLGQDADGDYTGEEGQ